MQLEECRNMSVSERLYSGLLVKRTMFVIIGQRSVRVR